MKKWYEYIPHPVIMLFGMVVMATLLTHLIPAGTYQRTEVDGRMLVVAGSFGCIAGKGLSIFDLFFAFPLKSR